MVQGIWLACSHHHKGAGKLLLVKCKIFTDRAGFNDSGVKPAVGRLLKCKAGPVSIIDDRWRTWLPVQTDFCFKPCGYTVQQVP